MREYLTSVYGNQELRKRLGADIEHDKFPHALIIEGAEGSGKMLLAIQAAAALQCEKRDEEGTPLPCGQCRRCRTVLSGNAPDVHVITREEDRATFGIEPVRAARADMYLSATEYDKKVYIFRDADLMTVQAQNALLIVLEEPPAGVCILLLVQNADNLLTTVRSRARTVRLERFTVEALKGFLAAQHPRLLSPFRDKNDDLQTVLMNADGCIGRALLLLDPKQTDQLLKENAVIAGILDAVVSGSFSALHTAFRALPTKRDELSTALTRLLAAFRDLIACKRAENAPLCFFTSLDTALVYAQKFRISRLFSFADATYRALELTERNANVSNLLNTLKCSLN